MKKVDDAGMRAENNRKLQIEINQNKLILDRTCFTKSQAEKDLLKIAKKTYKKSLVN